MRHLYQCRTRWADLDALNHVNNVVYVDYLQEARVAMLRDMLGRHGADGGTSTDLVEGVVVVRHEVTYLATMPFRYRPVSVESWITDVRAATFTMAYEVFYEDDGVRTVHLRATSVLAPYSFTHESPRRLTRDERALLEPYREPAVTEPAGPVAPVRRDRAEHFQVWTRFSDVDVYRHVNNVKYFEYLQESRIRMMSDLTRGTGLGLAKIVVAQTDVDYVAPILLRAEPYDLWSEVVRLGRTSMTIDSEISDGDRSLARARVVVVFFDLEAGRPMEPEPGLRELLEARTG